MRKMDTSIKTALNAGAFTIFLLSGSVDSRAQAAGKELPRPVLVYTDIVSGPNSGGENDKGIYLSLFGKNFGSEGLGSQIKVYIGGVEVDNYRGLHPSRGRPDIQQITVQIGALGKPAPGAALPIKVVVNGVASNEDLTFTVNPGRILFVDNVKGDDSTAVVGEIRHPFRHVQTARLHEGAWGKVRPGDFIVMRGTGTPWTDRGYQNYFARTRDKSGSAPAGRPGTGPISLMGYPGEDVVILAPYDREVEKSGSTGAISAVNGLSFPGMGQWFTVSNLRIEGGGHDGAVNLQIKGNYWRIVNNELTAATAIDNADAKAGGIAGNGRGQAWLGNHIHDIFCGPVQTGPLQNHGIYVDGEGDYEIAYNVIENIPGGSGFQTYVNGYNGSDIAGNIRFHHNLIDRVGKHGINLAEGSSAGIIVFNNIVKNTFYAGLRLNSVHLSGAKIYNNTFYNTNMSRKLRYGALMNDWALLPDAVDLENNIFMPYPGTDYTGGSTGFFKTVGRSRRNFWYGGRGEPGPDAAPRTGQLRFVAEGKDFRLLPGSWAIDAGSPDVASVVTNDYSITTRRPQGSAFDIGAFEHSH
ncbi:MAG TPA: right-handed parallel beta-helix repeat-containing protein [Burkholderiaceae bacterium]|nr:right-handed parallel beta-helix repeat-containing protein [Burkholderiaceae bacterium]